jgi:redox-sensitive bicupin YhaK (pirin superfamily)
LITLHRAEERQHQRRKKRDAWLSFHAGAARDPFETGCGPLVALDEHRLSPGVSLPSRRHGLIEILTYVREGALAFESSLGRSGVIHAGEFQLRTIGRGERHSETNTSASNDAHVFQIWLRPSEADLDSRDDQRRFSAAERRDDLCIIASPDARKRSLRLHQDALVYAALLELGQHMVHELLPGRSAWLHVVQGDLTFSDVVLTTGDDACVGSERAISFTARGEAEILLVDVRQGSPGRKGEQGP